MTEYSDIVKPASKAKSTDITNVNTLADIPAGVTGVYQLSDGSLYNVNGDGRQAITDLSKSAINPATISDGSLVYATAGKLNNIVNDSSVSVASGKLVCTDAINAAYVVLEADDTIQYMKAVVQFDSDCRGAFAMVIPRQDGTFPGISGTGSPEAGVHAVFSCWSGSAEIKTIASYGYGGAAAAITGTNGNITAPMAFLGATRTFELFFNKRTGRVVVQVDGITLVDYLDPRALSYIGKYGIFEFYGVAAKKPKVISIECSSKAQSSTDSIIKLVDQYFASATAIAASFTNTDFTIASANTNEGTTVVMVSAWIDQTLGDTTFRLTDGTNYSAGSVVARGAFNGRVTYIERLIQPPAASNLITLQAMNASGSATFGAFPSVGYSQITSQGAMQ